MNNGFYRRDDDYLRTAVAAYGTAETWNGLERITLRLPERVPRRALEYFFEVGHDGDGAYLRLTQGVELPKKRSKK